MAAAAGTPTKVAKNSSIVENTTQATFTMNTSFYNSIENFEVDKQIGKGQFSEVFRARCVVDNRTFALKRIRIYELMDAKARDECVKEIDLLKSLHHPNVVQYISSFIHEKDLFIVLELADAGDLSKMIKYFKKEKRLIPEKTIWKYFCQISSALEHMHLRRIMHRDLKPANIFLTVQGTIKLGDLGLSRFFGNSTVFSFSLVGTPYYMSPERIKEQGYEFQSDIWSLGCILYEMAALHSPFAGENMNLQLLIQRIEKCDYTDLPDEVYTQQLKGLVKICLDLDPLKRPVIQQICEIANQMFTYFQQNGNLAPPTPSPMEMQQSLIKQ